jgi:hypothetical protein
MGELISKGNFWAYLDTLPMQSTKMTEKQLLTVKEDHSDTIVSIGHSNCLYVDDIWFKKNMGIDKQQRLMNKALKESTEKTYSVEVKAMSTKWLFNDTGHEFLTKVFNHHQMNIYDVDALQMIIEFFYDGHKNILMDEQILYLVKMAVFVVIVIYNESSAQTKFDEYD